jgi:hypothetical protein
MTKKTDDRVGAVIEKLSPLQVTRHAVDLLRRLVASAADESLRPTENELETCANAVWRLPEHYRQWHIEVFDKAREILVAAAVELPMVALITADHVERLGREMAVLGVARASASNLFEEEWLLKKDSLHSVDSCLPGSSQTPQPRLS